MKKYIFLLILSIVIQARLWACGNEYYTYTKVNGSSEEVYEGIAGHYFQQGFNDKELNLERMELENRLEKDKNNLEYQSDYALVLLKLGDTKKSLAMLQQLIRKYPNEYNIVANLGTAYELNGMNDSALKYIKLAVKINPDSHEGSEWIHVKILEAKLKMEKYPDYLKTHSILGLTLNLEETQTEQSLHTLMHIRDELAWQLHERIHFVKAPDPVVADLLFTLANLEAITRVLEKAIPLYDLSLQYQPQDVAGVISARDKVQKIMFLATIRRNAWWIFFSCIILTLTIYLVVRIWKRRKARKNAQPIPVYTSVHIEK